VAPRVTIEQAIKISQLNRPKTPPSNPFHEEGAATGETNVEEVRERLLAKMLRLQARERAKLIDQGWTYDEAYDQVVPPGWVKAAENESGDAGNGRAGGPRSDCGGADRFPDEPA
jgi:hypothetical protein